MNGGVPEPSVIIVAAVIDVHVARVHLFLFLSCIGNEYELVCGWNEGLWAPSGPRGGHFVTVLGPQVSVASASRRHGFRAVRVVLRVTITDTLISLFSRTTHREKNLGVRPHGQ